MIEGQCKECGVKVRHQDASYGTLKKCKLCKSDYVVRFDPPPTEKKKETSAKKAVSRIETSAGPTSEDLFWILLLWPVFLFGNPITAIFGILVVGWWCPVFLVGYSFYWAGKTVILEIVQFTDGMARRLHTKSALQQHHESQSNKVSQPKLESQPPKFGPLAVLSSNILKATTGMPYAHGRLQLENCSQFTIVGFTAVVQTEEETRGLMQTKPKTKITSKEVVGNLLHGIKPGEIGAGTLRLPRESNVSTVPIPEKVKFKIVNVKFKNKKEWNADHENEAWLPVSL